MVKIMIREFEVTVTSKMVRFEQVTGLKSYHFKAVVDGTEVFYKVVNAQHADKPASKWAFGRASVEIQYHAKNLGNIVRFEPVGRKTRKRKKKISLKQLPLF